MEEIKEPEETGGKLTKAKTWSLIGKICASIVILAGFILKWIKIIEAPANEIIICGFSIMGVFGTIDANIIIDKFTGRS